jgi:hypothetical protein
MRIPAVLCVLYSPLCLLVNHVWAFVFGLRRGFLHAGRPRLVEGRFRCFPLVRVFDFAVRICRIQQKTRIGADRVNSHRTTWVSSSVPAATEKLCLQAVAK